MNSTETELQLIDKPRSESVKRASQKYLNKDKACGFASSVPGTATDRREKRCLQKAIAFLGPPRGISILDIPCGAGRMFPLWRENGYLVTGADISESMIQEARQNSPDAELHVADVFDTGFGDKTFDMVICHRLFQYFSEPADRRSALAELRRVAKGPLIISFSCNFAADHLAYKIKRMLGITRIRKCQPISFNSIAQDAQAVGLEVVQWIAARPLISKRWYAVMRQLY